MYSKITIEARVPNPHRRCDKIPCDRPAVHKVNAFADPVGRTANLCHRHSLDQIIDWTMILTPVEYS